MLFSTGDIIVYNPSLPDLVPPAERPRDIGRIRKLYDNYAEVYFPAAESIRTILCDALEHVDLPLPASTGLSEMEVERRRLEEQAQVEQAQVEQAQVEQAQVEQAQVEQAQPVDSADQMEV
uniref:Uncharacterized protein n=1 Tax=viral metagenome TaxID=1070528 RepID=A0A6C0DRZ4_9ZZZZ